MDSAIRSALAFAQGHSFPQVPQLHDGRCGLCPSGCSNKRTAIGHTFGGRTEATPSLLSGAAAQVSEHSPATSLRPRRGVLILQCRGLWLADFVACRRLSDRSNSGTHHASRFPRVASWDCPLGSWTPVPDRGLPLRYWKILPLSGPTLTQNGIFRSRVQAEASILKHTSRRATPTPQPSPRQRPLQPISSAKAKGADAAAQPSGRNSHSGTFASPFSGMSTSARGTSQEKGR